LLVRGLVLHRDRRRADRDRALHAAGLAGPPPSVHPSMAGNGVVSPSAPMLEVDGLSRHFGALAALNGVSFEVRPGEIFSVIGPNGAGKSTLFNVITGLHPPTAGRVRFRGDDITGLAPEPTLLLLDEPTAGMTPGETRDATALIRATVRERGLTLLLIEHDMSVVMGISDRIAVLHFGKKIAEGPPDVIRTDPGVIDAY